MDSYEVYVRGLEVPVIVEGVSKVEHDMGRPFVFYLDGSGNEVARFGADFILASLKLQKVSV